MEIDKLKFPIGKFNFPQDVSHEELQRGIADIEQLPNILDHLLKDISEADLNKTYRDESWNVRQVVHHLADSHINSLIRFKWTLTEDTPTIKAYDQKGWALTADSAKASITDSLLILRGLHSRWVVLLRNLTESDLKKSFIHPQMKRNIRLEQNIALYAWHGKHHTEHIKIALGL